MASQHLGGAVSGSTGAGQRHAPTRDEDSLRAEIVAAAAAPVAAALQLGGQYIQELGQRYIKLFSEVTEENPSEQSRAYSGVHNGSAVGSGYARSMLDSAQAWAAAHNDREQWMIIDAGRRIRLSGIVVMGSRTDEHEKVTRVSISVADDKEAGPWRHCGNYDCRPNRRDEKRRVELDAPAEGRFVKLNPLAWDNRISMRCGLIVDALADELWEPLQKFALGMNELASRKIERESTELRAQLDAAIAVPFDESMSLEKLISIRDGQLI
eukprot:COSAG06_NODE_16158_length_1018_cov_0.770403_2_plen_267_part_01